MKKKYHDVENAKNLVVIVCNGLEGHDCQYTATKEDTLQWQPIKPLDWSCPIKIINNVKAAYELGEKLFRNRSARSIKKEYNKCDDVIIYMKEKLVDMHTQINITQKNLDSMKTKVRSWTQDIYEVEKCQGQLRAQLENLGVDISLFSKPGQKIVPGFQNLPYSSTTPFTQSTTQGRVIQPTTSTNLELNPVVKLKRIKLIGKTVRTVELSDDQSFVDLQESEESITTHDKSKEPREQSEQSTVFKAPEALPVQKELLNVVDPVAEQSTVQKELLNVKDTVAEQSTVQKELLNVKDTVDVADTQQLLQDFQDVMGDSTPQVLDTSKDITVIDTVIPELSVIKTLPSENPNITVWLPPTSGQGVKFTPIYPYAPQQKSTPIAPVVQYSNIRIICSNTNYRSNYQTHYSIWCINSTSKYTVGSCSERSTFFFLCKMSQTIYNQKQYTQAL